MNVPSVCSHAKVEFLISPSCKSSIGSMEKHVVSSSLMGSINLNSSIVCVIVRIREMRNAN